ncbi:MAG: glucosyl-3-phosphoglycerate synthase [Bacillota bacterium]|nr:glucosyl-3-phosphoglycerate synthase [Bacillota bacterium]
MTSSKAPVWPQQGFRDDQEASLVIAGLDNPEELEAAPHQTVVMTEGWTGGPAAAVLRGGLNAQAVLEVLHGAGVTDLTIYHLEERIPELESVFLSSVVSRAHDLFDNVTICWRHEPSIYDLVRSIGDQYRMLFFGAPLAASEVGPFYRRLKEVYPGSVTIVRGPLSEVEFAEGDEIYKWVRERTFDAHDFALPAVLLRQKRKLGAKIAVILPSLNEENTVGEVIKSALEVKGVGLIDEVILIDSGSVDRTVEVARSYGIPVHLHRDIRPDLGSFHGKGEAMFKSTFVTEAEIIAWVDTDIASIAPRFFYGLFGPILTHPDIRFVKGYFARPIRVEADGLELGGGRVTEILARPWLNTFRPELSGYIQPLAGTVAIHRDLLHQMRIPVNYGVEIAMLIQAVEKCGLWSTCQVNLGEVVHRSKDVLALSEMSFQILQVLAQLSDDHRKPRQDVLRRVFSAHGQFVIGLKRFTTHWRQFDPTLRTQ